MGGGSGGGGRSGRGGGGDAGQPGEVVRSSNQLLENLRSGKVSSEEATALERSLYRQSRDAFFKEKNYEKSRALEQKYNAVKAANDQYKGEQAAKKPINWSKVTTKPGGSSVRDEGPSGRQMTNKEIQDRMKKLGKYNPPKGKPIGLER